MDMDTKGISVKETELFGKNITVNRDAKILMEI